MKNVVKKLIRGEQGAALILVLVVLLVGGLIAGGLLQHMGAGLLSGEVYNRRTAELYAADAGVEDAMWKIQHPDKAGYLPCSLGSDPRIYTITDINGKSVQVSIDYVDGGSYRVTSVAMTNDGGNTAAIDGSTTVEAYVGTTVFDLLSGALVSSGNVDFSGGCSVTGDVYYVGEVTGKEYEHVGGVEQQIPLSAFPTQQENEEFAQQFKEEAILGGTEGTMTITSDTTLGPKYITGDLGIDKGVTITLAGTIFVEGSIGSDKEYTVTGSGSIVAVGDINLHKMPDYGIESDTIIMSLSGQIKFWKDASIEAMVYAPNGSIDIEKDMTIYGGVIGAGINVKKDSSFTYVSKGSSFGFFDPVVYGAEIKTYSITQN